MSRDVDDIVFNSYEVKNSQWFVANKSGISQLKLMTRQEAHEFLYLRKGEDFGCVMQMMYELLSQSPETIHATYSMYQSHFPQLADIVSVEDLINLNWGKILAFYLLITKGKELIIKAEKSLESFWHKVRKGKPTPRIPDLQIICNPEEINEIARLGWESMGFRVRHYIDSKQAGSHRFYLTENSYCFFIKKTDSTFFGFKGSDIAVINELKQQFEDEWINQTKE